MEMHQAKLKWEKLGGKKKVSMRVHQYEREHLERMVTLGTCPLARGALASTARTISYVTIISGAINIPPQIGAVVCVTTTIFVY